MSILRVLLWALYWACVLAIAALAEVLATVVLTGRVGVSIGLLAAAVIGLAGITYAPTKKGHRP